MIYTVTFNPAIDYVMRTDEIINGATNRSKSEEVYFGGKGINVSLVLNELGLKSKALGFIAGFTGKAIEAYLKEVGIKTDFIKLDHGFTRINVKLKGDKETEINGRGPDIPNDKIEEFMAKIEGIKEGDTLILAGSIPTSLPNDIYEKILGKLRGKDVKIVVDATGDLLKNSLKYKPYLIKPNRDELGELFGKTLNTNDEVIDCAKKLRDLGARNVLVSMAGDGAVLVDENGEVYSTPAKRGEVINSVGAGDSMVAGFIAGADKGYDYALKLGNACGAATAFSNGLATKEEIRNLMED